MRGFSLLFFSCLLATGPDPAHATDGTPAGVERRGGTLHGRVRTSDGAALPGIGVELRGPGATRHVTTRPDGSFDVTLPRGRYEAIPDAPGLESRGTTDALVDDGEATLELVLVPSPVRERVVVSATRGEATLSTLGVASDVLDREQIEERARPELLSLLQEVPGVATSRAGGTGLQASAFIRGGESRYARVLVDGVPVNQPGGAFDFGTALPFELERVEVVRGAASSLYGSDALAGVVSLTTRRASPGERPSLRGEAEGGSDDWRRLAAASTGTAGRADWNAGIQRLSTDNAEPNSAFAQTSAALSSAVRLGAGTDLRGVFRLDDSTVGTPGPTAYGRPDLDARFERRDLVGSLRLRRSQTRLVQELALGYASTRQLSLDPLDSGAWLPEWDGQQGAFPIADFPDAAGFQNATARGSVSYQASLSVGARQLLTAGAEVEHERGDLGNRAAELLQPERTNSGLYLQDRLLVGARVYLTLGGRVERNGSYGTRAVPRAAVAARVRDGVDATTLRASAGMGVKEPSFLESYGESFFAKGNPLLEPERSTTFDLGLEQRLLASRVRLTLTAFHHDYHDQIAYTVVDYDTFEGTYVNLAHTRSRGLELALEARPLAVLQLVGQYTFQDGSILESPSGFDPVYAVGQPLLRRPRHQGSFSAAWSFGRGSLGTTLVRVGPRADSDFVGLGLTSNAAYTRLDARARLRVTGTLEAFVGADNLLDERYQEVLGYWAPGRSLRLGLRLNVGARP
jgi:vitamin B12 transporter